MLHRRLILTSLAIHGGVAPLRGGFGNGFTNPSFTRLFSSPDESGVTSKTPKKTPPLKGEGGGQSELNR